MKASTSLSPHLHTALPEAPLQDQASSAWANIWAISTVVIKELYRRKDFYVLFILTVLITVVMASVNIFNDDKIVRYLKELCLALIWVSSLVIAVTTTARQIPAEKENRTLFPLLAKPVSRSQIVLGKFLGCWLAVGLSLACFYLFFGLLSASREHSWPIAHYFQAILLHWSMLAIIIAFTLFGSVLFAAPSSNSTIVFVLAGGIFLCGRHLNSVALEMTEPAQSLLYGLYFIIPHLEFFDVRELIIHGLPLISWPILLGALAYAAVYTSLFLFFAQWRFRKMAVN